MGVPANGQWIPGSFLDNFAAAADHLGYENIGAAWGLASIPWPSAAERDGFLNTLTKVPWDQIQKSGRQ